MDLFQLAFFGCTAWNVELTSHHSHLQVKLEYGLTHVYHGQTAYTVP
jgi:hypothetical protein